MSRLISTYLSLLAKHPYKTQSITSGILMGLGDTISQVAVEKKNLDTYDFKRTGRFVIFGTVVLGPSLRTWYLGLDKIVKSKPSTLTTLKKVALDQMVFNPCFLPFFIGSMTFWRTYDFEIVKDKLKQDYLHALMTSYKIWPAAQLINFYFIPFHHRVLFTNCVGLFWSIYLAFITEKKVENQVKDSTVTQ